MKRFYGLLIGSFLLETVFSVFGQGIAYFLNENFVPIWPVYYLTGLTILGFLLYLLTAFLIFYAYKNKNSTYKYLEPIMILLFISAFGASIWSLFVTAMWWG